MVFGTFPDIPDPTRIAKSGSEAVKAVAQGGIGIGVDIATGAEQILFNTIDGSVGALSRGIADIVNIAKVNIRAGRTTAEKVRSDVDRACNSVLSQVDQAIGGEIVRKFKSEIEKQLR